MELIYPLDFKLPSLIEVETGESFHFLYNGEEITFRVGYVKHRVNMGTALLCACKFVGKLNIVVYGRAQLYNFNYKSGFDYINETNIPS